MRNVVWPWTSLHLPVRYVTCHSHCFSPFRNMAKCDSWNNFSWIPFIAECDVLSLWCQLQVFAVTVASNSAGLRVSLVQWFWKSLDYFNYATGIDTKNAPKGKSNSFWLWRADSHFSTTRHSTTCSTRLGLAFESLLTAQ